MAGPETVTVPLRGVSDGDARRWPKHSLDRDDPQIYLTKSATHWMQDKGLAEPGKKYVLDRLPDGYALFKKPREKEPTHFDRYLYGHIRYRFRSAEEFYEHFRNLMEYGNVDKCECIGCRAPVKKVKQPSGVTQADSAARPRRPRDKTTSAPRYKELTSLDDPNDLVAVAGTCKLIKDLFISKGILY